MRSPIWCLAHLVLLGGLPARVGAASLKLPRSSWNNTAQSNNSTSSPSPIAISVPESPNPKTNHTQPIGHANPPLRILPNITTDPFNDDNDNNNNNDNNPPNVVDYTSALTMIFGLEILTLVQNASQIASLCDSLHPAHIDGIGYLNSSLLRDMLCVRRLERYVPANAAETRRAVRHWFTNLWVRQVLHVFGANVTVGMCRGFEERRAEEVGVDGREAKRELCSRVN